MALQEDPLELTVNNLEKEQITRSWNHTIKATQLQDHLFLTKTVDKYHLKQTNIILNHKFFYQHNNNNNNFTDNHQHKAHMEHHQVKVHMVLGISMELNNKLQSRRVNSLAEVLELNSGDL